MMELVWVDGVRQPVDDAAWESTAASFFGVGYRTELPVVENITEPVNFHRALAAKLATTLGRPFDGAPWDFIEAGNIPVGSAIEVIGGWPSPDAAFEGTSATTPWTAISLRPPAPHDAAHADAVSLPWVWNSASPLASLPTLSRLEVDQAARHVQEVGAGVGLWWTAAGQLAGSTAGVPLVQVGRRSWVFPGRDAGTVSNWAFFSIASTLSAMPEAITHETLGASKTVAFVSGSGAVTILDSLDGEALHPDREHELTLLTTRLRFLP